jgi:hypothetical protein
MSDADLPALVSRRWRSEGRQRRDMCVWRVLTHPLSGDYGSAARLMLAHAGFCLGSGGGVFCILDANLVGARAVRCDRRSGGSPRPINQFTRAGVQTVQHIDDDVQT